MPRRQILAVITLCNLAAVASSANGIKNEVLARSSAAVGAAPEIDVGSEESLAQAADEAKTNLNVENHTPPVPSLAALQDAPQRSQRELVVVDTVVVDTPSKLQAALAYPTVDRIVLEAGIYEFDSSSACNSDSALCVTRAVTIEAAEAGTVVLDAKGARRVFYITGAGVQLVGLKITGGYANMGGGLYIASGASSTLNSCQIYQNQADSGYGGGLFIGSGGSATLDSCQINQNEASLTGGGLFIGREYDSYDYGYASYDDPSGGSATLNSCQIFNNKASFAGGGLYIYSGGSAATLHSCQIFNNQADFFGGGLAILGSAALNSCNIYSNTVKASDSGGGLFISGYAVLTCCTVEDPIHGSNYEEHDCPSPPAPAPPSMPPVQTGGDPITTFQGRETRYYLSTRRFTPVLDQGPIVVSQLAGPANPPPGLEAHKGAWVVAMEVDVAAMAKVLIETIDPTTLLAHPNATAPPATTDALTTMRLSVGGKQLAAGEHKLSIANAAAAVSAKRVGSKRRIGSGWVEQITITADVLKLRITSAKANKFADEQHQVLGLHLDVEFLTFDQSAVRGALPEMWGLQPMTEKTKELLDQESADN